MEDRDLSSSKETKAPPEAVREDWSLLPWHKLEHHCYRLQKRIYRASEHGNQVAVHRLQQLLMRSRSAQLLAVRKVSQDNQGKNTAGIDGVKSITPPERLTLAEAIHPRHHKKRKAQPVRRVWIPKPGKTEKRPLGIPTLHDRARQALTKLALEPEWEARFEANSYGFRPGRGCHDAIEAIFGEISQKAKYVLDADIRGCFDHIDQTALLKKLMTYPDMRRSIRAWLKAGILEGSNFSPSLEGTPQGGVVSPLLANIALHGMEEALQKAYTVREGKPALIRYADDFVVLHPTLAGVKKARTSIEEWLKGIGLELSPQKTKITHTLTMHEGHVGFDFLGQTVRQHPMGKTRSGKSHNGNPLGFKTFITPSKEASKQHMKELAAVVHKHSAALQEALIGKLNPIVTGWANYHKTVVAKEAFSQCDNQLYSLLRHWAQRRHPNKTPKWVSHKYWALDQGKGWTFRVQDGSWLKKHAATPIKRHVKVKGAASPYDGNLLYWGKRLKEHPLLNSRVAALLKTQHGICAGCGRYFTDEAVMEVDHIIPRSQGGSDRYENLQLLHRHCHDRKTANDGSNAGGRGTRDKGHLTEEPCAAKVASTVLKGGE